MLQLRLDESPSMFYVWIFSKGLKTRRQDRIDSFVATCSFALLSNFLVSMQLLSFKQVNVASLKWHRALEPVLSMSIFSSNNRVGMLAKVGSCRAFGSPRSNTWISLGTTPRLHISNVYLELCLPSHGSRPCMRGCLSISCSGI